MSQLILPSMLARRLWIAAVCILSVASMASGASLRESAFVRAVRDALPAIVNINGNKTVTTPDTQHRGELETQRVNGMGAGVIIDPRGYIVTNYHVVEGVNRIEVSLSDERTLVATLVAHDAQTDLALIKIASREPLPTIRVGTSQDLMLAEDVIAIGNAFGYRGTITKGIISSLHRSMQVSDSQFYHDLIQTDASINPGNSGGPLLNIDGEMIGINAAVRMGAQGIGFAIPVDRVLEITSRMIQSQLAGRVAHGLILEDSAVSPGHGLVARGVRRGSAAERAGLESGDELLELDHRAVQHRVELDLALLGRRAGDHVPVKVRRGDRQLEVDLVLGDSPAAASNLEQQVWTTLGLRLDSIDVDQFERLGSPYDGGMRVMAVREGSPAWKYYIREGDVLVGLLGWQTKNLEHVAYVIHHAETNNLAPLSFIIVRDGEPYSGTMQVSWSGHSGARPR